MKPALTPKEIRAVIADMIGEDNVLPRHSGDGHAYLYNKTGLIYSSVTTKTDILKSPHLKRWAASEAVKYIDKHLSEITPENKEQIFKSAVLSHKEKFEDAGNIGTQGHDVVDRYLKEWIKTDTQPADITKFIIGEDVRLHAISRSAEKFCNDFNIIPIASELLVASAKYEIAGTLDSLMMVQRITREGDPDCKHNWMGTSVDNWTKNACFTCNAKMVMEFCLVDWKTSNSIFKDSYAIQTVAYFYSFLEMTGLKPKRIYIVRLDKNSCRYEIAQVKDIPKAFATYKQISKVYDWLQNGREKVAPLVTKDVFMI